MNLKIITIEKYQKYDCIDSDNGKQNMFSNKCTHVLTVRFAAIFLLNWDIPIWFVTAKMEQIRHKKPTNLIVASEHTIYKILVLNSAAQSDIIFYFKSALIIFIASKIKQNFEKQHSVEYKLK